jgi:hypothetical protein
VSFLSIDEEVWWNRAVKMLVIVSLMSITTWAVVRANENGALSDIFGTNTSPEDSPSDSALHNKWELPIYGEWSTDQTITDTTPLRDGGLYAVATNEYSQLNQKRFPYPFLEEGIGILVEPYKETTITINGMSGNTFYWSIVNAKDSSISFHGTSDDATKLDFAITLTVTGLYKLTVEEQFDGMHDLSLMRTLRQDIWVKYVRRELSTLTDTDREEFLNAMHVLWDVSSKKGASRYSDKYKSVNYFALVHNDGGGNFICDDFHAGTGFLNNHVYLGMYLEQSLRLVNPHVSLHYMDYSKYFDSTAFTANHIGDTMDGGGWTEMLSSKWFGQNDPITGQILDGRWKDATIPEVSSKLLSEEGIPLMAYLFTYDDFKKSDQHISNPYGLLRAPWNYNPSPYLTRYNNLNRLSTADLDMAGRYKMYFGSNCAAMKSFFSLYAVGKTLQNFLEAVEDNVHGNIHSTFGGAGGDKASEVDAVLKDKYHLTDAQLFYVAYASHKFIPTYLSGRFLAFNQNPLNCTVTPAGIRERGVLTTDAAPGEVGGPSCACNSYYFESESNTNQLLNLVS